MHKKIAIFLIKFYRYFFSPLLGNNCRFDPSCSIYAIESLKKHSLLYAFWITSCRILRCNPWCKGGYDPVPCNSNCTKENKLNRVNIEKKQAKL